MVTQEPDPELVAALAKKDVKLPAKEDEDPREGAKSFTQEQQPAHSNSAKP